MLRQCQEMSESNSSWHELWPAGSLTSLTTESSPFFSPFLIVFNDELSGNQNYSLQRPCCYYRFALVLPDSGGIS